MAVAASINEYIHVHMAYGLLPQIVSAGKNILFLTPGVFKQIPACYT